MSSSWPSCSTAGAVRGAERGRGCPQTTQQSQERPRPIPTTGHQGLSGTCTLELRLGRGQVWPPLLCTRAGSSHPHEEGAPPAPQLSALTRIHLGHVPTALLRGQHEHQPDLGEDHLGRGGPGAAHGTLGETRLRAGAGRRAGPAPEATADTSDPPGHLGQDREVFIKEEGRGGPELFWNPSEEVRRQRLKRYTVLLEEQTELESER